MAHMQVLANADERLANIKQTVPQYIEGKHIDTIIAATRLLPIAAWRAARQHEYVRLVADRKNVHPLWNSVCHLVRALLNLPRCPLTIQFASHALPVPSWLVLID